MEAQVAPPAARRLEVAPAVRLAARCWDGDGGRPFVLVHGLASNAHLWDGVADRLAVLGHAVTTVDQRGHGQSDKPDDGYDFVTVTNDLAALIGAPGEERAGGARHAAGGD